MRNKNTYILFVFAIYDDPDSLVSLIGGELSLIAMSPDVRYFYGPQASIFTFTSENNFDDLNSLIKIMLGESNISYMFLPLDKTKFGSGFGDDINKHLFGTSPIVTELNEDITSRFNDLQNKINNLGELFDDDCDGDDELVKLKSKPYVPSVNEILDKIGQQGIKSLSTEEKTILDNYSKQL